MRPAQCRCEHRLTQRLESAVHVQQAVIKNHGFGPSHPDGVPNQRRPRLRRRPQRNAVVDHHNRSGVESALQVSGQTGVHGHKKVCIAGKEPFIPTEQPPQRPRQASAGAALEKKVVDVVHEGRIGGSGDLPATSPVKS